MKNPLTSPSDPARKSMIRMPEDRWAHPGALHEWWYINAHLKSPDGRRFGCAVAFFPDYYLFTLVDKTRRQLVRKGVERRQRLVAHLDGISVGGSQFKERDGADSYVLRLLTNDLDLDLELTGEKRWLPVQGSGKIREGLLGYSFYYALTNMSATGRLGVGSQQWDVEGRAWLDRQWGNWEEMGIGGWEWFSLMLSNGCEILATRIYTPVMRRACTSILSVMRADSSETHETDPLFDRLSEWTSPVTGSKYGNRWLIGTRDDIRIEVSTDFDDQEIHKGFWEGSCSARGEMGGASVRGEGFAEQVDRRHSRVIDLLTLSLAPPHFALQNLLSRPNLGVWELSERLGVWKVLSARDRHSAGARVPMP